MWEKRTELTSRSFDLRWTLRWNSRWKVLLKYSEGDGNECHHFCCRWRAHSVELGIVPRLRAGFLWSLVVSQLLPHNLPQLSEAAALHLHVLGWVMVEPRPVAVPIPCGMASTVPLSSLSSAAGTASTELTHTTVASSMFLTTTALTPKLLWGTEGCVSRCVFHPPQPHPVSGEGHPGVLRGCAKEPTQNCSRRGGCACCLPLPSLGVGE